jgi:hypothetical protein
MTCTVCNGEGAIWLGACEVDACPKCAALAEAAWVQPVPRRAGLRLVRKNGVAA